MRTWTLTAVALFVALLGSPTRAHAEYYDGLTSVGLDFDLSVYADASTYGSSYGYGYDSSSYGGCGASYAGCGGGYEYGGMYGSNWGLYDTTYYLGVDISVDLGSYYGYGGGDLYGYGYGGCGYGGGSCGQPIQYDMGCSIGYCSGGILPYPQPMPNYPLPAPIPPQAPSCNVCRPMPSPFPMGYPPANPMPQPLPYPAQPNLPGPVVGLPVGELPQVPAVRPPWGGCGGGVAQCPNPQPVRPLPTVGYPVLPQNPSNPSVNVPGLPGSQPLSPATPNVPGGVALPGTHGSGTYMPNINVIGTPPDRNRVPRAVRRLP